MDDTERFELKTHLKNIEMAIQNISETLIDNLMKVLALFTTAILLLVPIFLCAQPESFNVFYVKGTALLIEKNKKDNLVKDMRISSKNKK